MSKNRARTAWFCTRRRHLQGIVVLLQLGVVHSPDQSAGSRKRRRESVPHFSQGWPWAITHTRMQSSLGRNWACPVPARGRGCPSLIDRGSPTALKVEVQTHKVTLFRRPRTSWASEAFRMATSYSRLLSAARRGCKLPHFPGGSENNLFALWQGDLWVGFGAAFVSRWLKRRPTQHKLWSTGGDWYVVYTYTT